MLNTALFTHIQLRLPRNLIPAKEKDLIPLGTYLNRERNYPSVILIAENPKSKETIKVLFVNISKETYFVDDTFPSGHSQPTEIFVQSADPARAYSLLEFFYEYISTQSHNYPSTFTAFILAGAFSLEVISFVSSGSLLFSSIHFAIDLGILFISIMGLYNYFFSPQGLHIRFRESSIGSLVFKALHGEFRDNPVVSLLVTFIGTVLASLVLKLLGII